MKTIAVYGSLKQGKYNHEIMKNSEYLGATNVVGTLYRVSSYPAIIEDGDNSYEAEVYNVGDHVYEMVRAMELGAGYKEVIKSLEVVSPSGEVKDTDCIVYYADTRLENRCIETLEEIETY